MPGDPRPPQPPRTPPKSTHLSPAPTETLQSRAAAACKPTRVAAVPGEGLSSPRFPGQSVAGAGCRPRRSVWALQHVWLYQGRQRGTGPEHQELVDPVPPAPPLPSPLVSLFPCPQAPALLRLVSRKVPAGAREMVRHTGPAWPTAILTAARAQAGCPRRTVLSLPQLEKWLTPGPSRTGQGHPQWAVGDLQCLCPQPPRSEPSSVKGAWTRPSGSVGCWEPHVPCVTGVSQVQP